MKRPRWDATPGAFLAWAIVSGLTGEALLPYERYAEGGLLPESEEMRRRQSVRRVASQDRADLLRLPCDYCGGPANTVDHVVAVARGGTSDRANLVPACWPCNRSKGALTREKFLEITDRHFTVEPA